MFIINRDYLEDGRRVGTTGPGGITSESVSILRAVSDGKRPCGVTANHFHMYDGDGERCYSGWYVETPESDELEPLDCFGMPNAGCTEIRMRGADGKYTVV